MIQNKFVRKGNGMPRIDGSISGFTFDQIQEMYDQMQENVNKPPLEIDQ